MTTHPTRTVPIVACLSGDGIGPEVMAEAGRVIDAVSALFGIRVRQMYPPFGGEAIRAGTGLRGVPRPGCWRFEKSWTRSPTCAPFATGTST